MTDPPFHIAQIIVGDGVARLDHLRRHGPSAHAFTYKERCSPPQI
ncbi:MAG: DUF3291 domain-containing protein [Alphaproteobacteria bacterium]